MTSEKLLYLFSCTDDKYLENAENAKVKVNFKAICSIAVAACVCFALLGAYILTKPYKTADGFVIKNGALLSYTGNETEITIPNNVSKIKSNAFSDNENADKIHTINLCSDVRDIEPNAFANMSSLVHVNTEGNSNFIYNNDTVISADGNMLIHYEGSGTVYTVPESIKVIGASAFHTSNIKDITFNSSLEFIGISAFSNSKLEKIYLPDSLKTIDDYAFSGCIYATEGYIPDNLEIGENAFYGVPFCMELTTGEKSPLGEIVRGNITPSELLLLGNYDAFYAQLEAIIAVLNESSPKESKYSEWAKSVIIGLDVPDDAKNPETIDMSKVTIRDASNNNTALRNEVDVIIPIGKYDLCLRAYFYNSYDALYLKDAVFKITDAYFINNETWQKTEFGWSVSYETDGDKYCGIIFRNESGEYVRLSTGTYSDVPYTLVFSPDGTRCAVEFISDGSARFDVIALNGDKLLWGFSDYNSYLPTYFGAYEKGSLNWTDENNIAGKNEYGYFTFNIFETNVKTIKEI